VEGGDLLWRERVARCRGLVDLDTPAASGTAQAPSRIAMVRPLGRLLSLPN
jgi:hypothetical protein